MTEFKSEYPYATLSQEQSPDGPMYAAYCDSDCAEEIDFLPYDGTNEMGNVTIWFTSGWARKHVSDDRVELEQFGYSWMNVPGSVFEAIVSSDYSIGAAANSELIQPRYGDAGIVWRSYRR